MKTALVVGATGLVGTELVKQLIDNSNYNSIIVLARRKLSFEHPKINMKLISFDQLNELTFEQKIDDCFCTLGTTQAKSGKKGLHLVDFEYVVQLAQLCKRSNIDKMLIVSSQGANSKSSFFYMRTKGQMEEAVKQIELPALFILRPSLITGNRQEFRFSEVIGGMLYKLVTPFMVGKLRKARPVSAEKIVKSLVGLAQSTLTGNIVFESDFIQEY